MIKIAVDGGVRALGVAAFREQSLIRAALLQPHYGRSLPQVFSDWADGVIFCYGGPLVRGFFEKPQVYDVRSRKGDQADLIDLAIMIGRCEERLLILEPHCDIEEAQPKGWKGDIPKEASKRRVSDALTDEEKQTITWPKAVSLHHNVIDAIHMGLRKFTTRKA